MYSDSPLRAWMCLSRQRKRGRYWFLYFIFPMLKFISCNASCPRAKAPHRFQQTDGDLIWSNLIDLWMRKAFLFVPVCLLSKNESLRVAETTRNNGNSRRKSGPVFFCILGWPANDSDMRRDWIFSRAAWSECWLFVTAGVLLEKDILWGKKPWNSKCAFILLLKKDSSTFHFLTFGGFQILFYLPAIF